MAGPAGNCFRTEFRRRWRARNIARAIAVVICYGYQCLLVPILSLLSQFGWPLAFWMLAQRTTASLRWEISLFFVPQLTVVLFLAVTLCLLWSRALRALAYQD